MSRKFFISPGHLRRVWLSAEVKAARYPGLVVLHLPKSRRSRKSFSLGSGCRRSHAKTIKFRANLIGRDVYISTPTLTASRRGYAEHLCGAPRATSSLRASSRHARQRIEGIANYPRCHAFLATSPSDKCRPRAWYTSWNISASRGLLRQATRPSQWPNNQPTLRKG